MKLKDISSSDLKKIVNIITYIDEVDADNIPIKNQQVEKQVRARVDVPSLRRQEVLAQQGFDTTTSLMFIIRYIPNLDTKSTKLSYGGNVYEIKGLEDVEEMHLYWNILCERVV